MGKEANTIPVSAPDRILQMLKVDGPADAEAMAVSLAVSSAAVRQQLYALRDRGLVLARDEARPMGRPAKIWELTPAANECFPRADSSLIASLIRSTRLTFGESGMTKVLCGCVADQAARYQKVIAGKRTLSGQLEALVRVRKLEGFMANVQQEPDGSFIMTENHCPIANVVESCAEICDAELEIFRSILGSQATVERFEHMPRGDRRCAYRIRNVPAAS